MADSVFRSYSPEPTTETKSPITTEPTNENGHHDTGLEEPVDADTSETVILNALGIDDMVQNLPKEDHENLAEVSQYILDILGKKGVSPTNSSIQSTLNNLKEEMGLDPNAEPEVVLDRIGGVVKAWKGLTFITNPAEKRSLFMKLARQPDSKAMNKMVFEEMSKREVWS